MRKFSYTASAKGIAAKDLADFFDGWKRKPSPSIRLKALRQSDFCIVARAGEGKAIGFITAITDGALAAYIPFLEVLPDYRQKGVGSELLRRMFKCLRGYYMIDLLCDKKAQRFYEKSGMKKASGMMVRNFSRVR